MKRFIFFTLICMLPALGLAQFKTQAGNVNLGQALRSPASAQKSLVGLFGLDPSRLHISQSYQMNFMSMGGKGFSQGLYLNTMTYDFSFPLTMSLQWGIAHQPMSSFGMNPLMQNGPFISGAQLRYQPTKNMVIQLDYSQNPYGCGYDYWDDRGWGRW